MLDVLIKNGTVIDGTGSPAFAADIGIRGDTIVLVAQTGIQVAAPGQPSIEAATTIDATGKTVTPGFIDLHTHSDSSAWPATSSETVWTAPATPSKPPGQTSTAT